MWRHLVCALYKLGPKTLPWGTLLVIGTLSKQYLHIGSGLWGNQLPSQWQILLLCIDRAYSLGALRQIYNETWKKCRKLIFLSEMISTVKKMELKRLWQNGGSFQVENWGFEYFCIICKKTWSIKVWFCLPLWCFHPVWKFSWVHVKNLESIGLLLSSCSQTGHYSSQFVVVRVLDIIFHILLYDSGI